MTPTQRSLALLRERGCLVGVVEKWNPHAKLRQDLWGCVDLACLLPTGDPFFVQTTTQSGIASRREKIRALAATKPALAAMIQSGRLCLHGWAKRNGRKAGSRKLWTCSEEVVTMGDS